MIEQSSILYKSMELEAFQAFAAAMASVIPKGQVICLTGDLGAGKTTLAQGVLKAMGVTDHVTSPTYTVINLYALNGLKIWHMDAYRIQDLEELHELGFYDLLYTDAIVIIEWADRLKSVVPEDALWVDLHYAPIGRTMALRGPLKLIEKIKEVNGPVYVSP